MEDIWMVRAGRGSADIDLFVEQSVVAIGFSSQLGDRPLTANREELIALYHSAHPQLSKPKVAMHAGQIFRFCRRVEVGHEVLTYDSNQRRYYLGRVASAARYNTELRDGYRYVRDVQWTHRVLRDSISLTTRNSLGAIMTLFRLKDGASEELRRLAVPIEDSVARLDWEQMQDLVAGILRAMGYKTRVAPPGADRGVDRGVDIMASPDGLGLQDPRIFVEVKHRPTTTMGSQQLRTFLGGRQQGDKCLYVSTGGFTKDARYEAERSNVPITLLGLPDLRRLLVEHYEQLDVETKQLVPLARVYWPVAGE